ncbi:bromodomain-containing protein [Heterostelium album PN500]|uniref:Bromodomain-containing protein n=1 Tax=Heterostelium pallidum (strain ATCC 26659 / Pp 5 / PN500) TaxID=670386 RepID=D3BIX8_HETP5|nr:bromodomain-containing protein [Heterostelium album PN500]EFA78752.1 bromodomain-containing protein [Heterostelium album PN500]|eukprot:XP_020430876.1 bromodomain-containing protein [Heterostelium album PN500]
MYMYKIVNIGQVYEKSLIKLNYKRSRMSYDKIGMNNTSSNNNNNSGNGNGNETIHETTTTTTILGDYSVSSSISTSPLSPVVPTTTTATTTNRNNNNNNSMNSNDFVSRPLVVPAISPLLTPQQHSIGLNMNSNNIGNSNDIVEDEDEDEDVDMTSTTTTTTTTSTSTTSTTTTVATAISSPSPTSNTNSLAYIYETIPSPSFMSSSSSNSNSNNQNSSNSINISNNNNNNNNNKNNNNNNSSSNKNMYRNNLNTNVSIDDKEINFMVLQWLSRLSVPDNLFDDLFNYMNSIDSLPERTDWLGNTHKHNFNELRDKYKHCKSDHLKQLCHSLLTIQREQGHLSQLPFQTNTILGDGYYSLISNRSNNNNNSSGINNNNANIYSSNTSTPISRNLDYNLQSTQLNSNNAHQYRISGLVPMMLQDSSNAATSSTSLINQQQQQLQHINNNNNNNNVFNINNNQTSLQLPTTITTSLIQSNSNSPFINTTPNFNSNNNNNNSLSINEIKNNIRIKTTLDELSKRRNASTIQKYANSKFNIEECPIGVKMIASEIDYLSPKYCRSIPYSMVKEYKQILGVQGHRAPTYCFLYDKTGKIFITGSDDHLVKIWSSYTGRLLSTFRGHGGDITDMSINFDNSMLTSAANDNIIRVWNINNAAPIAVLFGHEMNIKNSITSISFCPSPDRNIILSSDSFGVCRLWDIDQLDKSVVLQEASHSSVCCAMFSKGGNLIAVGSGNQLKIWSLECYPPVLVNTLEGHTSAIRLMQYGNKSDAIISGSEDGVINIWRNTYGHNWEKLSFNARGNQLNKRLKAKLRTVIWSLDDRYIISADHVIRVWNAKDATLHCELTEHLSDVFVMEPHPFDSRLMMSAGYDSQVILWDIEKGVMLNKFLLEAGVNQIQISDGCFSPDGMQFGVTTTFGKWYLFELGGESALTSGRIENTPCEQFFHTDYQPVVRDIHGNVLDELTQTPPHMMPQPTLINYQGAAYSYQPIIPPRGMPPYSESPQYSSDIQRFRYFDKYERSIQARPKPVDRNALAAATPAMVPMVIDPPPAKKAAASSTARSGGANSNSAAGGNTSNRRNSQDSVDVDDTDDFDFPLPSDSSDESFIAPSSEDEEEGEGEEEEEEYGAGSSVFDGNGGDQSDQSMESDKDDDDDEDYDEAENGSDEEDNLIQTRSQSKKVLERKKQRILRSNKVLTRSRATSKELDEIMETLGLPDDIESEDDDNDDPTITYDENGNSTMVTNRRANHPTNNIASNKIDFRGQLNGNDYEEDEYLSDDENDESDDDDQDYQQSDDEDQEMTSDKDDNNNNSNSMEKPVKRKRKPKFALSKKHHLTHSTGSNRGTTKKKTNSKANVTAAKKESICPKWLRVESVNPLEPSYSPQIGDSVIYFHQGHKKYIETFPDETEQVEQSQLSTAEECNIINIKYIIASPKSVNPGLHQAEITLSVLSTGHTISVLYHVSDIPDYLVLASRVRKSLESHWASDDQFKMFYIDENQWFTGVITEVSPSDPTYPDSLWERIVVRWDQDGGEGRVSPWEIELVHEKTSSTPDNNDNNNNTQDDPYQTLIYKLLHSTENNNKDKSEIIDSEGEIVDEDICELYREPVDLELYQLYIHYVAHPMDYGTLLSRLENNYYRRVEAVRFDAELVMRNAFTYNQPNTTIARNSKTIYQSVLAVLKDYMDKDYLSNLNDDSLLNQSQPDDSKENSQLVTNSNGISGSSVEKKDERDGGKMLAEVDTSDDIDLDDELLNLTSTTTTTTTTTTSNNNNSNVIVPGTPRRTRSTVNNNNNNLMPSTPTRRTRSLMLQQQQQQQQHQQPKSKPRVLTRLRLRQQQYEDEVGEDEEEEEEEAAEEEENFGEESQDDDNDSFQKTNNNLFSDFEEDDDDLLSKKRKNIIEEVSPIQKRQRVSNRNLMSDSEVEEEEDI